MRADAAIRPTEDQIYLAERISEVRPKAALILPSLICALNKRYGVGPVTSALRQMHGFGLDIDNPVGYLATMLKEAV